MWGESERDRERQIETERERERERETDRQREKERQYVCMPTGLGLDCVRPARKFWPMRTAPGGGKFR